MFRTRTRAQWQELLEGSDVCFAPVMRFGEAHEHPHNAARQSFLPAPGGGRQVRPAPRLSGMTGALRPSYAYPGADTDEVLRELGVEPERVASLRATGVLP